MLSYKTPSIRISLLRAALWGIALWIVIYLAALFYAAPRVRQLSPQSGTMVSAGPLALMQVQKIASTSQPGYSLAFTMRDGTAILGATCFMAEAFVFIGLPVVQQWSYRRRLVQASKK